MGGLRIGLGKAATLDRRRCPVRVLTALGMILGGALVLAQGTVGLQPGQSMPDHVLSDSAGKETAIRSIPAKGNVLVLHFWSFKCPVSLAYDPRAGEMSLKYESRGVTVLAVASNSNETAEEVRRNAVNLGLPFPVLLDRDGSLAETLGATHTPYVFIFDREGILRYRGAFDNNRAMNDRGRVPLAEEALRAILAGSPVREPQTKAFGCSIKLRGF